jgi:cobalt-zinc-cadmium efflux system outer membrane protein
LAADSRQLRDAGRLTGGDVLIAEAEASDARQAELQAGSDQQLAQLELRAVLGMSDNTELLPEGELNLPPVADPAGQELVATALENQPELQAKAAALAQADAAVALARANSVPDVTAGPAFEYDEAKSYFVGATLQVPLQIFNRKQGELLQAEAERARAAADLEQSRLKVKMRTVAAAQQYATARRLADSLRRQQLPASQQQVQDAEKLLAAGQVDLLKVVEVRRRNLALREQLLDAESRAIGQLVELETLTGQLPLPSDERDHQE